MLQFTHRLLTLSYLSLPLHCGSGPIKFWLFCISGQQVVLARKVLFLAQMLLITYCVSHKGREKAKVTKQQMKRRNSSKSETKELLLSLTKHSNNLKKPKHTNKNTHKKAKIVPKNSILELNP